MASASTFSSDKYVSVTTFRKDGTGVPTPVWFALDGDALVVWTVTDSGKIKRIRRNGDVTVAKCDIRGHVSGPAAPARAAILDEEESARVRKIIAKRYGIIGRISVGMSVLRRGKTGTVGLAITFP
jgi:PPOX class probable F420-dependent enzyme